MVTAVLAILGIAGFIASVVYTFKNKISFLKGICLGTLCFLVPFAISTFLEKSSYGISPIDLSIDLVFAQMKNIVDSIPKDVIEGLSSGEPYAVVKATLYNQIEMIKQVYTTLYPSIMIITYSALTYVLFMLVKGIRRILKKDVSFIPDFNMILLNKSTVFIYAAVTLLALLLPQSFIADAFLNLQVILSAYISLCGMSVIDFYLSKKVKNGILRFIIYIVAALLGGPLVAYVIQFASFVAMFDAFKHIRLKI